MLDTEHLFLPLIILFSISIILIIIFIIFTKKFTKKITDTVNKDYSNYKNELKEQNDILIRQILDQISNNGSSGNNDNPDRNLMDIFKKLRESIMENCLKTMNDIDGVRIAIYLFHNGVRSSSGIHFFKLSCICDKVAVGSGVKSQMMEHVNIPVNLFDDLVINLENLETFIIYNNEDLKDSSLKKFITVDKINYAHLAPIFDINNELIGFVSVEFDKAYSIAEVDIERIRLKELVKQLVPVLSYSDYISIKVQ